MLSETKDDKLEHVCDSHNARAKMNPAVFVYLNHYCGLGPVLVVRIKHESIFIGSGSDPTLVVIHIIFCPFCGVNLKGQLVSQNLSAGETEAETNAAH